MKNKSNTRNYLKIYFWQILSLFLRFLTLFIVVPFLSYKPVIYGVYSVCISILIFLNYADLGFMTSSTKYAAEAYSRGNREEETEFIGFGAFILIFFSFILSFFFFYSSYNLDFLFSELNDIEVKKIAYLLLILLAIFTPLIALQRIVSIIFNIRMQGYINKIVSIITSFITIISTFYFFSNGKYMIVEYFLFFQIMNFIGTLVMFLIAKKKYHYNLMDLFKKIRFSNKIYLKSKNLAFSGFYIMISWVLFYELDQAIIGRFIDLNKVAIFSISVMLATLFRSIFGIIFTPFNIRANHYVGVNNEEGLNEFIKRILLVTAPITILPSIGISIISKPLILTWVGIGYIESVSLAKLFALLFSMSFITYTTTSYLVAKEKIKEMYLISVLIPLIYWLGVYLIHPYVGLISFPIFKLITVFLSVIYYLYILNKYLKLSIVYFLKEVFMPVFIPAIYLILIMNFALIYLPENKSKLSFIIVIFFASCIIMSSFILQYIMSKKIKLTVNNIFKELKK